jgi:uncharacterized membrane protein (DUF485 family)
MPFQVFFPVKNIAALRAFMRLQYRICFPLARLSLTLYCPLVVLASHSANSFSTASTAAFCLAVSCFCRFHNSDASPKNDNFARDNCKGA